MPADSPPVVRFNRSRVPFTQALPASSTLKRAERPETPNLLNLAPSTLPAHSSDPSAVRTDAEIFLRRAGHTSLSCDGKPDSLRRAGLNVRKASDKQHLEAIAQAYAFYVQLSSSPNRAAVAAELENLSGRKRTRTTTDLHLIVDRFVSYGGDTPAERLAARKLISRDVRAIQHLEATRVLPSRVQVLGGATGEGLHAWARRAAVVQPVRRKPTKHSATETRSEQRQRALIHDVTITTRRPDGTRKRHAKLSLTGVLAAEMKAVRQRLMRMATPLAVKI